MTFHTLPEILASMHHAAAELIGADERDRTANRAHQETAKNLLTAADELKAMFMQKEAA